MWSDPAARVWAFFSFLFFGEDECRRGAGGVDRREEELAQGFGPRKIILQDNFCEFFLER